MDHWDFCIGDIWYMLDVNYELVIVSRVKQQIQNAAVNSCA